MARLELRRLQNVSGDFFVDSTCIDCDLCRQIAPRTFESAGDMSAVHLQPQGAEEEFAALKALVTCPTASIGASGKHSARLAAAAFPDPIEAEVSFCGYAAEDTFGASSYLIEHAEGNLLVDVPRFARPLVRNIEKRGGLRWIFLTHQDDVAGHERWAEHFGAQRILHADEGRRIEGIETRLCGDEPVEFAPDLVAIPTPGHTRGHMVLLYRSRFLFTGDHLWADEEGGGLGASRQVCWYSWPEQIRSMQRLRQFRFEWVLPGHGRRHHAPFEQMQRSLQRCIDWMQS